MASDAFVLLVEDDSDIREMILEALKIMNVRAKSATCGSEAILSLQSHEKPALILLDLMMPNTDGIWFCNERKKFAALMDIPVVIMSADGKIESKAKELSISEFLPKPINLDALMKLVIRYLPS